MNNMIAAGLQGVEFIAANTDAQVLASSNAQRRIQLGLSTTKGLGAGSVADVGRDAALETMSEIMDHLSGFNMCFITAGMGGGTGTGAAPAIARAAREAGILTVAVVTKPFGFEGSRRMRSAEQGLLNLLDSADTVVVIPNQNLFALADPSTTLTEAFAMADRIVHEGVSGIANLITREGMVNLDFADVRAVMQDMGAAMMGTGEAEGEGRAIIAVEAALSNPLFRDAQISGARGVLVSIAGGRDMTLYDVDEAATRIRNVVATDAQIIVGASLEEELERRFRVSVVATGLELPGAQHWRSP